jgi:hypothetical protein
VPVPDVGNSSTQLSAVDAGGSGDVWAVGSYRNIITNHRTLMMRWNGGAWEVVPSPNLSSYDNVLSDVTVSQAGVWATGYYVDIVNLGQTRRTLAIHDGRVIPSPNVGDGHNALWEISASGSTAWGVGSSGSANDAALVIKFSGSCAPSPTVVPAFTATGTRTVTPTWTVSATPTACPLQFTDVPPENTFYQSVRCLACRGVLSGYADGTFRPNNPVTRGQLSKIVSNAAGFIEPVSGQTFEDVTPGSTFYEFVERLASREVMSGYACGGLGEPCTPDNRPYFRPGAGATRGQLTKIVSNAALFDDTIPPTQQQFADVPPNSTFWLYVERLLLNRPGVMSGYTCGGPGEPCDTESRPYFRPGNPLTRGQTSKIVANTFFPACQP